MPTSSPSKSEGAPSETPSEEPSSPEPSEEFVPRTVTMNVSGDLLWHNSLWKSAEVDAATTGNKPMDFVPQLESLRDYVSRADIGVCHSEVPFAPEGGPYKNYPLFSAPPHIAPALVQIGWDICTTASNHTMDQGWDGLVRTIDTHEEAGLLTVGSYRTEEESKKPVIFETESGAKVGFVSQTYGLNGIPKAKGKPWSVELLDADSAIEQAKRAKEAGADIVAIHIHAGDEYVHKPNAEQVAYVEKVTASEYVDLVFGQHAHVVQPIDKVNGKWVIYGLGNLIASSGPAQPYTYDGAMAEVTFTETEPGVFGDVAVEWAPTMITKHRGGSPARVYLIPSELERQPKLAKQMEESAARTRKVITSTGVEGLVEFEG